MLTTNCRIIINFYSLILLSSIMIQKNIFIFFKIRTDKLLAVTIDFLHISYNSLKLCIFFIQKIYFVNYIYADNKKPIGFKIK